MRSQSQAEMSQTVKSDKPNGLSLGTKNLQSVNDCIDITLKVKDEMAH